ncbi:hypothetical protein K439DRAFT_1616338 [Ramaria rubella]|nr:hypothetical protein K439DRAFT_1616338 [Ramaria rubella]
MSGNKKTITIPSDVEIIDLTGLSIASSDGSARDSDREISVDASVPWYHDPNGSHPFTLTTKGRATRSSAPEFTEVEFFPWGNTPLEQLWGGEIYTVEDDARSMWSFLVQKWRDTVVVCGGKVVRLIHTSPRRQGSPIFQVALPSECKFVVSHVKWALNPWSLHPLLIYTHSSVLHIYDAESRTFLGCMRGHGGDITSLGVHHMHPHLVFTTSRDCTTRIYDLRHAPSTEPEQASQNLPRNAFGMLIEDDSRTCSLGKCVVILTGGRSGGHEAAVLGAMDHALRIWHLSPVLFLKERFLTQGTAVLYGEDKPLFSSTLIHDARVLSVHCMSALTNSERLSHETLLSHSAPRIARVDGRPVEGVSGTLTVWQWLSIGRFFPPGASTYRDPPLRGCISDYRESCEATITWLSIDAIVGLTKALTASFKLISNCRLPPDAWRVSVHCSAGRPPLILIPIHSKILVINACHLPARPRPSLVDDRDVRPTKKARHIAEETGMQSEIEGWELSVAIGEDLEDENVVGCAMSMYGEQIAGVGGQEGMWMWTSSTM